MNLKPICKIKLHDPEVQKKLLPITSLYADFCQLLYMEKIPDRRRATTTICEENYCRVSFVEELLTKIPKANIADRVAYTPVFDRSEQKELEPMIRIGTIKGNTHFFHRP